MKFATENEAKKWLRGFPYLKKELSMKHTIFPLLILCLALHACRTVHVETPTGLTDEQKKLLLQFAESFGENTQGDADGEPKDTREQSSGFFKNLFNKK